MAVADDNLEAETPLLDEAPFGIEVAERFGYYGINSNLITYLTGPLGRSVATAAADFNAWTGTALLMSLVGAFVADSFLGRFRTIVFASLLFILGLGFMSLSSATHSFDSNCKINADNMACSPPPLKVVAFFASLCLVAFAEGGLRPSIEAFGADQFDEDDKNESRAKSSFFNWWYFIMHGSCFVALLILNYIQENLSWELGFGIPCIMMCFTLMIFLLGSMRYRFRVNNDERDPFVRIGRVFVKAARNWQAAPVVTSIEGTRFKFLEKAILADDVSDRDTNVRDVDDAKTILSLAHIWCTCWGYAILFSQLSTLFTKQGSTMNRYITSTFQIPAASLQSLMSLSIVVFIPIYDRLFVPISRSITTKPAGISTLQRIGTGLFLSFLTMVVAAVVERCRLATAVEHGLVDNPTAALPMSMWWLAPQYLLFGISDVFVMVGLQEFFYDQVPGELKSIRLALYISIFGIWNFLSSFLISVVEKTTSRDGRDSWFSNNLNRAHLDYFYWLLGGLSLVTMMAFVCLAKAYVYKRKDIA
ncbi:hypothetical protein ACS0TY_028609 [Phlomoides rotata]